MQAGDSPRLGGGNKMNTHQDSSDTEKRINNGLLVLCLLFAVVIGALGEAIFAKTVGNHWAFPVILVALGFGLNFFLQRIRPPHQNAGAGWSRFYTFTLTQTDLRTAFRRNK
jgi:hypothetical protein